MSDQVLMLWELGLIQADFVVAPHNLDTAGLVDGNLRVNVQTASAHG